MDLGKEFMEQTRRKKSSLNNQTASARLRLAGETLPIKGAAEQRRRRSPVWVLLPTLGLAALVGLVLLLIWGSQGAEGYTVGLSPAQIVLDVSSNGSAAETLRVTIDNSDDVCTIAVEVQTTVGGGVDTDPSVTTVGVTGQGEAAVPVNISTEPGAEAARLDGTVRTELKERCGVPPINPAPRTTGFQVIILQYALVEVNTRLVGASMVEGDSITLHFSVANLGNGRDSFNLSLRGLPTGWTADYPANLSDVEPGPNGSVAVEVALKASSTATANLRLVAVSGLNSSVMAGVDVQIKAESTVSWLWPYGAAALGGGALAAVAVVAAVKRRRKRTKGDEW